MKKLFLGVLVILLMAVLGLSGCSAAPASGNAADFYQGKTVTIIVPNTPESVVNIWCRLAVPYFEKIAGVKVQIENDAAAGGLVARNRIYSGVKPDGLTLLFTPTGAVWPTWALDLEGTQYDITKLEYLGGINGAPYSFSVLPDSPYSKVDAAAAIKLLQSAKGLKFGASSPSEGPTMGIMVTIVALGLDGKITAGYKGINGRLLALTQKEVDAICNPIDTSLRSQESGQVKILFLVAEKRDKNFPDVPALGEFVKFSDKVKSLFKPMDGDAQSAVAPPGTPKDRVEFLRKSWANVFANKTFQEEIIKVSKVWLGTVSGEEQQKMAATIAESKKDYLALYNDLIKQLIK